MYTFVQIDLKYNGNIPERSSYVSAASRRQSRISAWLDRWRCREYKAEAAFQRCLPLRKSKPQGRWYNSVE